MSAGQAARAAGDPAPAGKALSAGNPAVQARPASATARTRRPPLPAGPSHGPLGRPATTAVLLSDALALTPAHVDQALSRLVEWGLATGSAEDRFTAAPPATALGALVGRRRVGLRAAEQALLSLAEGRRAAMTRPGRGRLGAHAVRNGWTEPAGT
ncbi:hypothetical protein [Streptomyces sp. NPDC093105]|uniref:hypothetical protein n=1 Tax=Streptomyces sp. NPDC093105 TaxID=3366029 RepID=UPI0038197226